MTVPIFQSFRSTVSGWVRGERADRYSVLEDPTTGAPVGIQSPRGNGPQGIWAPVDLTSAQIASPTAEMIADLNADFRLNAAPYTHYRSNGTTLVAVSTGGATPSGANPTASVGPAAVNGSAITFMRSDGAPALAATAVTPGSYTNMSGTVDQQGRLTAASSGAGFSGPITAAALTTKTITVVNGIITDFS